MGEYEHIPGTGHPATRGYNILAKTLIQKGGKRPYSAGYDYVIGAEADGAVAVHTEHKGTRHGGNWGDPHTVVTAQVIGETLIVSDQFRPPITDPSRLDAIAIHLAVGVVAATALRNAIGTPSPEV
jgi:hypothetical protein